MLVLTIVSMKSFKPFRIIVICTCITVLLSSCNQRFGFRSKVKVEKDTTEAEKQYHIVW